MIYFFLNFILKKVVKFKILQKKKKIIFNNLKKSIKQIPHFLKHYPNINFSCFNSNDQLNL